MEGSERECGETGTKGTRKRGTKGTKESNIRGMKDRSFIPSRPLIGGSLEAFFGLVINSRKITNKN
jgi:hypothetical protein